MALTLAGPVESLPCRRGVAAYVIRATRLALPPSYLSPSRNFELAYSVSCVADPRRSVEFLKSLWEHQLL